MWHYPICQPGLRKGLSLRCAVLAAAALCLLGRPLPAAPTQLSGVREVAVQGLPDIAVASFDLQGPVIYYNPVFAAQAGPEVAAFARAHEYGHVKLGHVYASAFTANPYLHVMQARSAEIAADQFATEYWAGRNPRILDVVVAKDLTVLRNFGDMTHLPTADRAALIVKWRDEFLKRKPGPIDPAHDAEVACPNCHGSGRVTTKVSHSDCLGTGRLKCAACLATGMVRNAYGQIFRCPGCGGTGRLVCVGCGGTGKVGGEAGCSRCRGTGKIHKKSD